MTRIRISSIYSQANAPAPTGAEAERRNAEAFQHAWHQHGLIVIRPDDIVSDWDRQFLVGIAEKKYGKRGTR